MGREWRNPRQRRPSQTINDAQARSPGLALRGYFAAGQFVGGHCEGIAGLKLPDTTIMIASTVPAGEFSVPESTPTASQEAEFRKLPAFCRVQGVIRPSSDSTSTLRFGCRLQAGTEDISASATVVLLVRSIISRRPEMRLACRKRYQLDMQLRPPTPATREPSPTQIGLLAILRRSLTTATALFIPLPWTRRT